MRRNVSEASGAWWHAVIMLLAVAAPAAAMAPARSSGGVVLFPAEMIVVDAGTDQMDDRYRALIRDISFKVLADEMRRAPAIDWLETIADAPPLEQERLRIAKEKKATYLVREEIEFIRGNALVTTHWTDLRRGRSGSVQAALGKEDLADFDRVARSIRDSGRAVVDEMTAVGKSREGAEALLVSCFKGGESVSQPFLDRFLTTELPQHLARELAMRGISSDRIRVDGLSFDAYDAKCLPSRARTQSLDRDPFSPLDREFARYEVSGSILPAKKGYSVLTRVSMTLAQGLAPLGDFHAVAGMEPGRLPELLAEELAIQVRNFLVERRLQQAGIQWSTIPDGTFDRETEEALQRFQRERGLLANAQIDEATLGALELR